MRRIPVESSAVVSAGYDDKGRFLEVEFAGGRVYRYLGVPPEIYREFMRAESCGDFVDAKVKPFYHSYRV